MAAERTSTPSIHSTQYEGKDHATYEPIDGDLYQGEETLMAGGTIGEVHYAHQSNINMQEYAVKGAAVALDPFIAKDKAFKYADWPQQVLLRLSGQALQTRAPLA